MNTMKKHMTNNYDISRNNEADEFGRKWEYINLDEFETQVAMRVREQELIKYAAKRKAEHHRLILSKQRSFVSALPKITGLIFVLSVIGSVTLSTEIGRLMLFAFGLLLLIPVNRR